MDVVHDDLFYIMNDLTAIASVGLDHHQNFNQKRVSDEDFILHGGHLALLADKKAEDIGDRESFQHCTY